jgi:DNA-binding GntR family transcriptional regulator
VAEFAQVQGQTLRQEVLEQVRRAILLGQLPVGRRLLEVELATRMGVSRIPVRDALRQLEHEGLVHSYPHRSAVVAAVDEDEVELLYHLRADLEAFAVQAVMRGSEAQAIISALQGLVEAMRAGVRASNLTEVADRDLDFHRTIVECSNYRTLARVWRSMDGPVRARLLRALTGPFQQDLVSYTAESHQPIVDAMASGDLEMASDALKHHVLETRTLVEGGLAPRGLR